MTISEEMITFRARNNMTQEQMAKKCGLSRQTIWSIENGLHARNKMTEIKIKMVMEEFEKRKEDE